MVVNYKNLLLHTFLPPTSLDGFMQKTPATLVHHVHVCFVVDQRGGNALQLARERQVQRQVTIVVQLIQLPGQLYVDADEEGVNE